MTMDIKAKAPLLWQAHSLGQGTSPDRPHSHGLGLKGPIELTQKLEPPAGAYSIVSASNISVLAVHESVPMPVK
jgi:hypothetical protein